MSAKEMFEELGYEYYKEDNYIEYIMSACIPNRINTETISFIKIKFYDKHIYIESYETDAYLSNRKNYDTTLFSTYELKAINKQIEELCGRIPSLENDENLQLIKETKTKRRY